MSAFETVTVTTEGLTLRPTEIRVTASASEACRSFSARLTPQDRTDAGIAAFAADVAALGATLARGPACTIAATGDPVLVGWIERYRVKLSSSAPEISIEGRSDSGRLVDCSAIPEPGEWRDRLPTQILADLAGRHGVRLIDRAQGTALRALFRLTLGESVVSAAWRLARVDGHLLSGGADGGLIYYRGTLGGHGGGLIEGETLPEDSEAVFDWSKRAKTTRVKGQRASGWSRDDLEIDEEESDGTVRRPVERIVVASEEIDAGAAKRRARWHRDQAAGEGLKVTAPRCIGWRDADGALWTPAQTVWVESAYLGVAQDMAIESVEFSQTDREGTVASLSLVDPRALGGKAGKGSKSGRQWTMPK